MARKKANERTKSSPPKAARGGRAPAGRLGTKAAARRQPEGDGEAAHAQSLPSFPVIGIGASAGGLEACTQILETLPADLRAAVILVQHLDPKHDSALPVLLGTNSRLP